MTTIHYKKDMKNLIIILLLLITFTVHAVDNLSLTNKAQGGTGFRINDTRTLDVTEDTVFLEDGKVIPITKAQGGTGYKVRYKASDTNPNFTAGQLQEMDLINIYKPIMLIICLKKR